MEARELKRMTVEEYVALDRASEGRWEYVNGEAFAMAGASLRHNAITVNLTVALHAKVRGGPCRSWADGISISLDEIYTDLERAEP